MRTRFLFLNCLLLFITLTPSTLAQTNEPIAIIKSFKGDVFIDENRIPDDMVKQRVPLHSGAKIKAQGQDSIVIVEYTDKSRYMLIDGELTITTLEPQRSILSLIKGMLFNYINPESSHQFKVQTKRGSFGVRGTKFWLQEDERESYLCVCEGVVSVRNNHSLMFVNKGEDLHMANPYESLEKKLADKRMWRMSKKGFKLMDLEIPRKPE